MDRSSSYPPPTPNDQPLAGPTHPPTHPLTHLHLRGQRRKEVVVKGLDLDLVPAGADGPDLHAPHLALHAQGAEPAVAGVLGGGVACWGVGCVWMCVAVSDDLLWLGLVVCVYYI